MSVLVLRHEPFEHLGSFGEILRENNLKFVYHDLDDSTPRSVDGHKALVVMGGPMSANDPLPALSDEMRVIEAALQRGMPVLGVCLGGQLLARVLGARVYRNPASEIGWAPVSLTDAGRADPVFSGVASPTTFFHWHSETFDLPTGAEWLAWSELCRHQAYRFGPNAYGLQFHPEMTPEMIADWTMQPVNCADVAALERSPDPHAHDSRPAARSILERWLSLLSS
jgi:GMP synthase (glutamine-hydrolysing)